MNATGSHCNASFGSNGAGRGRSQLMYRPMVEIETTAPKATVEFSMGRPRMKANMTMAQTAFIGVPVMGFTLDQIL